MLFRSGLWRVVAGLLFFLSAPFLLSAASKPIEIQGDTILIDEPSKHILSTGNVRVLFDSYRITSNRIEYNWGEKRISIPSPAHVQSQKNRIKTSSFDYDLETNQGHASKLRASVSRLHIYGDTLAINQEKVVLQDASFTTCQSHVHPHYMVESKKIHFYPNWGFFVSFGNRISLKNLPFSIPIPTYIYGSKKYGLLGNSSLIPEFGSNKTEGSYLKEHIGYFLSKRASGTITVGTTEKLGVVLGVHQSYLLNDSRALQGRTYLAGTDGFEGHVSYRQRLFYRSKKKQGGIDSLFSDFAAPSPDTLSEWTMTFKHRELINDYRVSYRPQFNLSMLRRPLGWWDLEYDSTLTVGHVFEERRIDGSRIDVVNAVRETAYFRVAKPVLLSKTLSEVTHLHYYAHWFDTQQAWHRLFAEFSFKWRATFFSPRLSYTKRLLNKGATPFQHERQYAQEGDEVGVSLFESFKHFSLSLRSAYDIDRQTFRKIQLEFGLKRHCRQLSFIWNVKRNQVGIGGAIF